MSCWVVFPCPWTPAAFVVVARALFFRRNKITMMEVDSILTFRNSAHCITLRPVGSLPKIGSAEGSSGTFFFCLELSKNGVVSSCSRQHPLGLDGVSFFSLSVDRGSAFYLVHLLPCTGCCTCFCCDRFFVFSLACIHPWLELRFDRPFSTCRLFTNAPSFMRMCSFVLLPVLFSRRTFFFNLPPPRFSWDDRNKVFT